MEYAEKRRWRHIRDWIAGYAFIQQFIINSNKRNVVVFHAKHNLSLVITPLQSSLKRHVPKAWIKCFSSCKQNPKITNEFYTTQPKV